ncbi:MAG TPA: hypothetical protein ENJ29_13805 [Bacteroidetes bacterium]|nr:hypothetical protein [Bacteroidota bacterium]
MDRFYSWIEYKPVLLAGLMLLLALASCDKKPTGINVTDSTFPPKPTSLTIKVGDGQITLQWQVEKPEVIRKFNVYRGDSLNASYLFLDSTLTTQYTDREVQNGREYFYRVTSVNTSGLESLSSDPISAKANVYAINIENGAEYTASRQVTIDVTAPTGTTFITLSNDSSFSGATPQPFQSPITWTLSLGDGRKTVYAKFRDPDGNETAAFVQDQITLDTQAVIRSVTENTNGQSKRAGDVIHFTLNAGESGGTAMVSIVDGPQDILLYDNGSNGDTTPDDGLYEVDYTVPDDADVSQAKVRGSFTDRVGNVAAVYTASTRVTILKEPAAVTAFIPTTEGDGKTSLRLTWSASQDAHDFSNYSIYRRTEPNVTDENGKLVTTITSVSITSYVDGGLTAGTTYYYRIYVFDKTGLKAASNEVVGQTVPEEAPTAVVAYTPLRLDDGTVQVTWTQNSDTDFASYRIFRSTSPNITTASTLRSVILEQTTTSYIDTGTQPGTTYYYKVYVFDAAGNQTGSNEVSITLPEDAPPAPVVLSQPTPVDSTGMRLTWSQSLDSDFSYYSVYRSQTSPVDTTAAPIVILNADPTRTEYTDTGLTPRTAYFYRVFVVDKSGQKAGSNEVRGETR